MTSCDEMSVPTGAPTPGTRKYVSMYDVMPGILAFSASCSLIALLVGVAIGYSIGRKHHPRPATSHDDFPQQQVSPSLHEARRWPHFVSESHDHESLN